MGPGRIWTKATIEIFLGIAPAESAPIEDFNDRALAWREAIKLLIPPNRRLMPYSLGFDPSIGDFRWEVQAGQGGKPLTRNVDGVDFYGISVNSLLSYSMAVTYQS